MKSGQEALSLERRETSGFMESFKDGGEGKQCRESTRHAKA
jgi:hypothetical protein